MTTVTLPGEAVLRLVHSFLCEAGLYATARSLEVEGLADPGVCTSPSASLLRALCLDGQFDELTRSLQDVAPAGVMWAIKRQQFLEAFDAVAETPASQEASAASGSSGSSGSPTAQKVHQASGNASKGQLLASLLQEARELSPSRRDFNSLCYVLSLPAVGAHPELAWWTPHAGRLRVWQAVAEAFEVPVNASDVPAGQLPRLLAHAGGFYLLAATGAAAAGASGSLPRRITFDPTRPVPLVPAMGGDNTEPGTPSSAHPLRRAASPGVLLPPQSPSSAGPRPSTREGLGRGLLQAVLGVGGPHTTSVDLSHLSRRGVVAPAQADAEQPLSRPATGVRGGGITAVQVTAPLSGPVPLLAGRVSTSAPALLTPLEPSEPGFGSPSRGAAAVAALNRSFVVEGGHARRQLDALVSPPSRAAVARRPHQLEGPASPHSPAAASPGLSKTWAGPRHRAAGAAPRDAPSAQGWPPAQEDEEEQEEQEAATEDEEQQQQQQQQEEEGSSDDNEAVGSYGDHKPLKIVYVPAGDEDEEDEEGESHFGLEHREHNDEEEENGQQHAEQDEDEEGEEQEQEGTLQDEEQDEEASEHAYGHGLYAEHGEEEEEEGGDAYEGGEDVVAAVRHLSFANMTGVAAGMGGSASPRSRSTGVVLPSPPRAGGAWEWPSQISLRESEAGIAALLAEAGLQRPLTAGGAVGLADEGGLVAPAPEVARPPLLASPARGIAAAPPPPPGSRSPARSPAAAHATPVLASPARGASAPASPLPAPFSPRAMQAAAPPPLAPPAASPRALPPPPPPSVSVPVWDDAAIAPTAVWCEAGNQPVRVAAPLPFDPLLPPLVVGGTNAKALHLFACEEEEGVTTLASAAGVHAGSVYCCDTFPEAPDSLLVATGSNDTLVKITRVDTGGLLTAGLPGGAALSAAVSFPGEVGTIRAVKWLQLPAASGADAPARFWLGLLVTGGHPTRKDYGVRVFEVGAVDVTPEGECLVTLAPRARRVAVLRGHTDAVNGLALLRGLTQDDVTIVTGSADGTVKTWSGLADVLRRGGASPAPAELAPSLSLVADEEGGPVHALVQLPPHALPAPTTLATLVCAVGTGLLTAVTLTTDRACTSISGMAQRLSTSAHFHTQEARGLDVLPLTPHEWVLASVSFDGTLCVVQITELTDEEADEEAGSRDAEDIPTLIATLLTRAGSGEALRKAAAAPGMVPALRTHTTSNTGGHTDKVLSAAWLPAGTHASHGGQALQARLVTSGGEGRIVWWQLVVPLQEQPVQAAATHSRVGPASPGPALQSPSSRVLVL